MDVSNEFLTNRIELSEGTDQSTTQESFDLVGGIAIGQRRWENSSSDHGQRRKLEDSKTSWDFSLRVSRVK
jgi:hypothetical protein